MNIKTVIKSYWPDVTRVRDAKFPLEIEVLPRDGRNADPKNPSTCALARACKRALKVEAVLIAPTAAYLKDGTTAVRYTVPESVRREIVTFDRHGDFAAGSYNLRPPSPTRRLGQQPKYRPEGKKTGERNRRRPIHRTTGLRAPLHVQE